MAHLTEKDVRSLADYARIGLLDEELTPMTKDLNAIIDNLQPILDFNLEGVEPTTHPYGCLENVMREDVVTESFTQEQALANAPHKQDGSFLIPAILGGDDN